MSWCIDLYFPILTSPSSHLANRFFMTCVQLLGILMLLYEAGALIYNIIVAGVALGHP